MHSIEGARAAVSRDRAATCLPTTNKGWGVPIAPPLEPKKFVRAQRGRAYACRTEGTEGSRTSSFESRAITRAQDTTRALPPRPFLNAKPTICRVPPSIRRRGRWRTSAARSAEGTPVNISLAGPVVRRWWSGGCHRSSNGKKSSLEKDLNSLRRDRQRVGSVPSAVLSLSRRPLRSPCPSYP